MSKIGPIDATPEQIQKFLDESCGAPVAAVERVGAGAWSVCFGFRHQGQNLVARFGRFVDDFYNDQRACAYAGPDLPVPALLEIGPAFDGYYAISTRVYGTPLESLEPDRWQATVPSVAAALEALRLADISANTGFGGWGRDGNAPYQSWAEYLLTVADPTSARSQHDWRQRLATDPQAEASFARGFALLQEVAREDVPRSLIHADLINRNVLVDGDRISGVFDWGCSAYGDHLYELAWFEFWAPWHPEMDVPRLRAALEKRWQAAGYAPHNQRDRLLACYLHIGLDHLKYNANLGDWPTLAATADRMNALIAQA